MKLKSKNDRLVWVDFENGANHSIVEISKIVGLCKSREIDFPGVIKDISRNHVNCIIDGKVYRSAVLEHKVNMIQRKIQKKLFLAIDGCFYWHFGRISSRQSKTALFNFPAKFNTTAAETGQLLADFDPDIIFCNTEFYFSSGFGRYEMFNMSTVSTAYTG